MTDKAVAWLRQQILARKALAEGCIALGSSAVWVEQSSGVLVTGDGTEADVWHGTWPMGDSTLTRLMEANDPRDTIVRCEAELAILEGHPHGEEEGLGSGCWICQHSPEYGFAGENGRCETVRAVASAYRHRDGYAEHWGNG